MRLAYVQELVLAAGVGLALARYRDNWTGGEFHEFFGRFEWALDAFLAGFALVGGLGTLIERMRGKSPMPWGPGRWAWVLIPLTTLAFVSDSAIYRIGAHLSGEDGYPLSESFLDALRGLDDRTLLASVSWFLIAFGLTWRVAPKPTGARPDAREWSGRAFACVVVVAMIGLQLLGLTGLRPVGGMADGFR